MARVLFIETSGDGLLDLAIRAKALGHQVKWFCQSYDPVKRPVGKGLIERVPDFHPWVNWADLILLAGNGRYMREADSWRSQGIPVIGGGVESASWELDRNVGMQVLKRAGIAVPAYSEAKTYDQAIAIAKTAEDGIAIKPCGDIADKSLSFVAKTPKEAIWRLERWRREGHAIGQGLMLQERISGIEFACGAWFGPAGFVEGWEQNHEFKKFFPGDLGPNTGEQGTVLRLVRKCKLADKVLKPLEDQLHRIGFVGNIDVNTIVSEGKVYPLEFTMRFGYPAIQIELALHESDPIEFLACVASGEKPPPRRLNAFAVGVVCQIAPYPFAHAQTDEVVGIPIEGITPSIEDNIHFCDVQMGKEGPETAGPYVLVSTGTGSTVVEARREALRVLNRLHIYSAPYWRGDIGSRLRSEFDELQRHGFCLGAVYAS